MTPSDAPPIVLVGANGRVGRALVDVLSSDHEVRVLDRYDVAEEGPFLASLRDAADGASVLINVAGVAHLSDGAAPEAVARLAEGNIALPIALTRGAIASRIPLIHVSSSKARESGDRSNAYGWSKRSLEHLLRQRFDATLKEHGVTVTIVRPPAMLFPPFDAGKLRRLRGLGRVPEALVPPLTLPVLTAERFLETMVHLTAAARDSDPGVSVIEFERRDLATLRDVHQAMLNERGGPRAN